MKLFLIRHGEVKWKKIGFLSYTDLELTKKGIFQSRKLALHLKKEKIDEIYSSPLKRCIQTAKEIGKYLNLSVCLNHNLQEVNFGIFERLSIKEAERKYPEMFKKRQLDKWNFRIPEGESYKDAAKRLLPFIKKLAKKKDKNIVIVTHVTIIKILLKVLTNLPMEEIDQIYFLSTSITNFGFQDKKFKVIKVNDFSHLKK